MFKEMVPEYLIPRMLEGETIADPVSPASLAQLRAKDAFLGVPITVPTWLRV